MGQSLQERLYRWLATLFIAGILIIQAATIPFTAARSDYIGSKLYPIVAYDMYRETHYDGERVDASWILEGVDANGRVVEISNDMLKVSVWDWKRILHFASLGDQQSGVIPLKELVQSRAPGASSLTQLRISSLPIRVTRNGPQTVPSEILATISLEPTR